MKSTEFFSRKLHTQLIILTNIVDTLLRDDEICIYLIKKTAELGICKNYRNVSILYNVKATYMNVGKRKFIVISMPEKTYTSLSCDCTSSILEIMR